MCIALRKKNIRLHGFDRSRRCTSSLSTENEFVRIDEFVALGALKERKTQKMELEMEGAVRLDLYLISKHFNLIRQLE